MPNRLTKSSAALESDVISSALATAVTVCEDEACGVKVTVNGQLAPGTRAAHTPVTVKSGVVVIPVR